MISFAVPHVKQVQSRMNQQCYKLDNMTASVMDLRPNSNHATI